jgi:hypothetical protein
VVLRNRLIGVGTMLLEEAAEVLGLGSIGCFSSRALIHVHPRALHRP